MSPSCGGDAAHPHAWLQVRDEREHSFVDATSFAVMRDRRITESPAIDGDVTAAGFTELRL